MGKVSVDIEDLLVWAYRDELPKAQAEGGSFGPAAHGHAWEGVAEVGVLGEIVDNRWGVVPDRGATSDPHPDAVLVGEAVEALGALTLDVPEGWWPFDDMASPQEWGDLGAAAVSSVLDYVSVTDADGARRFKMSPAWLVRRAAIMRDCPGWEVDEVPVRRLVRTRTGQNAWFVRRTIPDAAGGWIEVEQDGFNHSRRRPYPGAYQRWELAPSPHEVGIERAEYEVWHAALCLLADDLADKLAGRFVLPPRRPSRPWVTEYRQPVVLSRVSHWRPAVI